MKQLLSRFYAATLYCKAAQRTVATASRGHHGRPDLDFDYLLEARNKDKIRQNIVNRKQVGDIDTVHDLWYKLQSRLSAKNEAEGLDEKLLNDEWDKFYTLCSEIPNKTHSMTPIGSEENSTVIQTFGELPKFSDFKPRTAEEIGKRYSSLRYDVTNVCGDKAYAFIGPYARMESALLEHAVQKLIGENFTLISVPDVLNLANVIGLAFRPEKGVFYRLINNPDYCLAGTSEMGILAFLNGKAFEFEELPKKFAALSQCYRPEAPRGKKSHGIYRVHEFTKVEMFGVTANEDGTESEEMLKDFVRLETELFQSLGLHFRVMEMASEELGAPAFRKIDIEGWMPGRGFYGELSSASNCTDYQSRRLDIRYRPPKDSDDSKLRFVHTLNATACASVRTLIALVETHQLKNWSLSLPQTVTKHLQGQRRRTQLKAHATDPKTVFAEENATRSI